MKRILPYLLAIAQLGLGEEIYEKPKFKNEKWYKKYTTHKYRVKKKKVK